MLFNHSKKQKLNYKLLLVFLTLAICFGCNRSKAEGEKQSGNKENAANNAPIAVTVDKAISREVPAVIQTTGSLVADETSNIAPKTAGKVVNIYANVGKFVGRGSVIARIDDAH